MMVWERKEKQTELGDFFERKIWRVGFRRKKPVGGEWKTKLGKVFRPTRREKSGWECKVRGVFQ